MLRLNFSDLSFREEVSEAGERSARADAEITRLQGNMINVAEIIDKILLKCFKNI